MKTTNDRHELLVASDIRWGYKRVIPVKIVMYFGY